MKKLMSSLNHDQSGIASILITMIMMIVISLLVLSFAQISGNEQQRALQQQLSAQAFYAAESGVNDAIHEINEDVGPAVLKPSCTPTPTYAYSPKLTTNVSYSCLIVPQVNELNYSSINSSTGVVVPLTTYEVNADDSTTLVKPDTTGHTLSLTWQDSLGTANNVNKCPQYTPGEATQPNGSGYYLGQFLSSTGVNSWPAGCPAAPLRLDIVQPDSSYSRSTLDDTSAGNTGDTMTVFLYPVNCSEESPSHTECSNNSVGQFNFVPSQSASGQVIGGHCTPGGSGYICSVSIGGLTMANTYYMRLIAAYPNNPQAVQFIDGDLVFGGAQVDIDSTGLADSVLKRIEVSVPLNGSLNNADFALQSTDSICKQFSIVPVADGGNGLPKSGPDASASSNSDADCVNYGY